MLHYGKAEARAADLPSPCLIDPVKPFEYPRYVGLWYAYARVSHVNSYFAASRGNGNADPSALLGVFYGVIQKIHHDLLKAFPVADGLGNVLPEIHLKDYALVLGLLFKAIGGGTDEFIQVHALRKKRALMGF